jgi:hypothetical protein
VKTILPEMEPFPLEDVCGAGVAKVILERSMDKGIYKDTVQFQIAGKLRSVFPNVWGASILIITRGVMARDTMKTFVTRCPAYCLWFERFVKGMHSRMGDDTRPDITITKVVMIALMNRINIDYIESNGRKKERFFTRAGLMFLAAYFGFTLRRRSSKINEKAFH